ncbi:HAD family hydrolase [Psychrosphaera sp. B3R10]|uniref:HAD family hydrolase n=1 Tax=unclassified Psychrosphaera TaxID=2641570 RepID=UPI001C08953D|nr:MULTISPECIES: HAD family hydrolase [unclassified Psychrosphaera]MBU2881319.1 HAD family hydrolase [Psychrosphaera sp. I2R16]MBU2988418.1 HAD family hydrolase [Psychrosphaera sp. B3R10]MDO6720082.1 HAD family hydrolase [Psychrosphaera sp. 1_MG-2023]
MLNTLINTDLNSIELIIFDCDGVLIDSEILSQRVLLGLLKELGVDVSEDYFHKHFLGFNFEHVTAKVLTDFDVILTTEFRHKYRKALIDVFETELNQTEQLEWMLSQLNIKTCVATSSSPEKVSNALRITNLASYFVERVFTASEVENGKPAPDLFLHAANKMGVLPENCLVIEDSVAGLRGALAAKMHVLRYVGAGHLKNRDNATQTYKGISTISHWKQLFEKVPSLSTSLKV